MLHSLYPTPPNWGGADLGHSPVSALYVLQAGSQFGRMVMVAHIGHTGPKARSSIVANVTCWNGQNTFPSSWNELKLRIPLGILKDRDISLWPVGHERITIILSYEGKQTHGADSFWDFGQFTNFKGVIKGGWHFWEPALDPLGSEKNSRGGAIPGSQSGSSHMHPHATRCRKWESISAVRNQIKGLLNPIKASD